MARLKIGKGLIQNTAEEERSVPIKYDYQRFGEFNRAHVTEHPKFNETSKKMVDLHAMLLDGKNDILKDGNVVMTGWKTESPFVSADTLDEIQTSAGKLAKHIDDFWSCGIGGSYLGISSTISAVKGDVSLLNMMSREQRGNIPRIFFIGANMDPNYTAKVLILMKGNRVGGSVISKSGGTVEPAIAFAIIKDAMEKSYSQKETAERIIAVTDAKKGALKQLAGEKGYKTYVVPDNVGGRYSVTCPVGLFSLAVAGIDIKEFIAGARYAEEQTRTRPFEKNIAMLRAALRYMAHKYMGKDIEVASTGAYDLKGLTYWMQQLGPESEGKNGEGLWISPEYYTEMAHANGQMIQTGKRNMIETFLAVENPGVDVVIPATGTPVEYLDGKTLNFANTAFVDGLRDAHYEGGVPISSYILRDRSAFTIGAFYQYEMNAIALSGLMLGQNPFIQPGVQLYKKIADARSGKPGTEKDLQKMKEVEANLNSNFVIK